MKNWIIFLALFFLSLNCFAQLSSVDSAKLSLGSAKDAQSKFKYSNILVSAYLYSIPDSSLIYVQKEIIAAREMGSDSALSLAFIHYGILSRLTGNFSQAIEYGLNSLKTAEKSKSPLLIATAYYYLSAFYLYAEDNNQALVYSLKSKQVFETGLDTGFVGNPVSDKVAFYFYPQFRYAAILLHLAETYSNSDQTDSAFKYGQSGAAVFKNYFPDTDWSGMPYILGNIYSKSRDFSKAIQYYHSGMKQAEKTRTFKDVMDNGNGIAAAYYKMNQPDSAIYYIKKVLEASYYIQYTTGKLEAFSLLANLYRLKNNNDSTLKYLDLVIATKALLFNNQEMIRIRSLSFNEQMRQLEIENIRKSSKEKLRNYLVLGALLAFIVIAVILYRNNRVKQKTNKVLKSTLSNLKATQSQLIQAEKMASLGELTAGIAHEIQNPLNFVNNFSEVSGEMLEEARGKRQEAKENSPEVSELLTDIKQNLEKINHHGKRADAIVKGMLQHSQSAKGIKEPTDINALAHEYLRLAYHGFRAKDPAFHAELKTDFDDLISEVNVVPQDIGTVLLNLYNNAFYAVREKRQEQEKEIEKEEQSGKQKQNRRGVMRDVPTMHDVHEYQPEVSISTKRKGNQVEITVKDNGNGIPQKVVDKIFQPFFTTKPTGQGTGLGLSLSYDIVKAHGGEIKVNSIEGKGCEFLITLIEN